MFRVLAGLGDPALMLGDERRDRCHDARGVGAGETQGQRAVHAGGWPRGRPRVKTACLLRVRGLVIALGLVLTSHGLVLRAEEGRLRGLSPRLSRREIGGHPRLEWREHRLHRVGVRPAEVRVQVFVVRLVMHACARVNH